MSDITRDYSFGGWIKWLRLEREWTLRAAAKRLGMDPGNLSKLERSELDPPRNAAKVDEICRKLKAEDHAPFLRSVALQHHIGALKQEFGQATCHDNHKGKP
jgi:transcriptional regulator with XRE-family HTH domain